MGNCGKYTEKITRTLKTMDIYETKKLKKKEELFINLNLYVMLTGDNIILILISHITYFLNFKDKVHAAK